MKKLMSFAAVAALVLSVCAQDKDDTEADDEIDVTETVVETNKRVTPWPAFFAVCDIPTTPDLIGVRLTIPFSTKQENVTGLDIGLWGRSMCFEGIQLNVLRNDVKDQLSGFQFGLYNTAAQSDLFGVQVGLWNEVGTMRGVQAGLVNVVGSMHGVQLGVINRAEDLYGFQVGLINVIRSAELKFFPVVNIGF